MYCVTVGQVYLETSWAFDGPIHSKALLATILCWKLCSTMSNCSLLVFLLLVSFASSILNL